MKPALSVIFFTVVSGTGYGLLFLFGLAIAFDPAFASRAQSITIVLAGTLLVIAGLLSSTLHLGQPQRAWRAFSQWRSSWLSREGISAALSLIPVALLLADLVSNSTISPRGRIVALLMALLSLTTVYCTAKIYSTLRTIRAWCNAYVLPGYLLFAALGGASMLLAIHTLFDAHDPDVRLRASLCLSLNMLVALSYLWKRLYWRYVDGLAGSPVDAGRATGLDRFGRVGSVEAPHTQENYLTHEMGFALARKHARKLRETCLLCIGPLTGIFVLAVMITTTHWPLAAQICALACAVFALLGLFIERWLFFAEARHIVMSYYARQSDTPSSA